MNFMLDNSKTKILKIIIGVFVAVWTIIFIPCLWIIFSTDEYEHLGSIFTIILGLIIYLNAFRFFKMVKDNDGTITELQLKIWLMLLASGVFRVMSICIYCCKKYFIYNRIFFNVHRLIIL